MVVTYQKDLDTSVVKHDYKGVIIERQVFASCDGPAANGYDTQATVLNDGGCPQLGDSYPGTLTGYLVCVERSIRSQDAMTHWITCQYAIVIATNIPIPATIPLIEIGASIQDQQSNIDGSGNAITLTYVPTAADIADVNAYKLVTGEQAQQGGTFSKGVPIYTVKASRLETVEPSSSAVANVGHVNSVGVQIGKTVYATGTLLCRAVNGVLQQGNAGSPLIYHVDYEFQYNANGWTLDLFWIAQDGHTIGNARFDNGARATIQPYPTVSFVGLNLNT